MFAQPRKLKLRYPCYTIVMSNFNAFSKAYLKKLLEPFAPGMAPSITPIKFEAITPDCFLLLFRTTGTNSEDHFFVSMETDYKGSLVGAKCTIEDWHGEVIKFWPLQDKRETADDENIKDFQAPTSGPYFAMLAEVSRPTHKGYWAEAVKIMPGDNIGEKIKRYSKKDQANIRKTLASLLHHSVNPKASFLESFESRYQDTLVDDVNKTNIVVSLYVQPNGEIEYFYNYADVTVGGRKRKPKSSN